MSPAPSRPSQATSSAMVAAAPSLKTFGPRPQPRSFSASGSLSSQLGESTLRPQARAQTAFFRPRLRPGDLLEPDPPPSLAGADSLLCLAVAVYHEARDQPLDGQLAVASVILNRTAQPERWGRSPCEVVRPGQFSFFAPDGSYPRITDHEAWDIAVEMSREALERGPSTLVGHADHYYAKGVNPAWDEHMLRVIRIDDHIFFADAPVRG